MACSQSIALSAQDLYAAYAYVSRKTYTIKYANFFKKIYVSLYIFYRSIPRPSSTMVARVDRGIYRARPF
jgi:hypothetical protein